MAIVYSRWQLKPGADRKALGDLALEMCRAAKGNEGVRSARYFWADSNTVTTLTDYEAPRYIFAGTPTPEGTKRGFALSDIANRIDWEVWQDARAGTDAYERAR
jgi:hypothetical protein